MTAEREGASKRIKLNGARFDGGRLPVDSLVELQRYQQVVRRLAELEWRSDHPGEDLPHDFDDSVSLTITEIREGSADVHLAFEQHSVYVEYQQEAQDAADSTLVAAYTGQPLPELASVPQEDRWQLREEIGSIGKSLADGQSIEFFAAPDDANPIVVTVESRQAAQIQLGLPDFLLPPVATPRAPKEQPREVSVVGHVTAVNTKSTQYEITTAEGVIRGWYRDNSDLLDVLKKVLDDEASGPLTRITGELRTTITGASRLWNTTRVESIQFDDTAWGRHLSNFAALPEGWAGGFGKQITSDSLEAAQQIIKHASAAGTPVPALSPTEEGGVLLEWADQEGIRSIEILADTSMELFAMKASERVGTQRETTDVLEAARFAGGDDD